MTDRQFILNLLASGVKLPPPQQLGLFTLENATELIKVYLQRNPFSPFDNSQLLLFDRPDSPEIVSHYVSCGYGFNPEIEYKLFDLPNAEAILTTYVVRQQLYSNLGQLKLFAFPSAATILKIYIENRHELNPPAQLKLFDLPNAEELAKLYKKNNLNLSKKFKQLFHQKGWHKN